MTRASTRGGIFRTRERRSDWEKTCALKAEGEDGPSALTNGIHYPLFVLGKMPCDRGVDGLINKAGKKKYGGAEAWKAEQLRRQQHGVSGDWSASTWRATKGWQGQAWDSRSDGWNAPSAVADNADPWAKWKGSAMQASAVADAGYPPAATQSSGCRSRKGAGKGQSRGRRQPPSLFLESPPGPTRYPASDGVLQDHPYFAEPAAIPVPSDSDVSDA